MKPVLLFTLLLFSTSFVLPAQNARAKKGMRMIVKAGISPEGVVAVYGIPTLVVETERLESGQLIPCIAFLYAGKDRVKTKNLGSPPDHPADIQAFLRTFTGKESFPFLDEVPAETLNAMDWGDMIYLEKESNQLAVSGMTYFPRFVEERKGNAP